MGGDGAVVALMGAHVALNRAYMHVSLCVYICVCVCVG